RGQALGRDEQLTRFVPPRYRIRLVQPLPLRGIGRAAMRISGEIIRLVVDAQPLDLPQRAPGEPRSPVRALGPSVTRELDRPAREHVLPEPEALRASPLERLHRHQTAEDPRQREDAEHGAEKVMPAHPAAVADRRRKPERAAGPELDDT